MPLFNDWHFVMAGPDDGGHLKEVKKKICEAGRSDAVTYIGSVGADEKWSLLRFWTCLS